MRYLWQCKTCGQRAEVDRPLVDIDLPPDSAGHEACSGEWERLIAPSSFILTGGGWYKDSYKKG